MMTRAEHLEWAKERALEYWSVGDLANAVTSMISDMGKHDDLKVSPLLMQLGMMELMRGDQHGVRSWIIGFN